MNSFSIAVKAIIENKNGELLLIKRSKVDAHKPFVWEIPGGRLNYAENPFDGLKREIKEETGLEIDIKFPLSVHYFTKEDGQKITMIVFFTKALSEEVKLSNEHLEYKWLPPYEAKKIIFDKYIKDIERYEKLFASRTKISSPLKKGKYLHYKGKYYEVLGVARNSENLEEFVVYKALYPSDEFGDYALWVRPRKIFEEEVIVDGKKLPRFKNVE